MSILLIMAIQYDSDKIVEHSGTGAIKVHAMNVGTPRSVLEKALMSLKKALINNF